jgi:hypothetical protein
MDELSTASDSEVGADEHHWSKTLPGGLLILLLCLDLLMQAFGSKLPENLQFFGAGLIIVIALIAAVWLAFRIVKEWRARRAKGMAIEILAIAAAIGVAIALVPYLKRSAQATSVPKPDEIAQTNTPQPITPPSPASLQNNQNSSGNNFQGNTFNGSVTIAPAPVVPQAYVAPPKLRPSIRI